MTKNLTIETILDLYDDGVRNIILYGPPGTGKTYTITGKDMLLSKLAEKTIEATESSGFEDILQLRYEYSSRMQSEVNQAAEEAAEEEVRCQDDEKESFHSKSGEPWEFSKWEGGEWQSKIHYEILQFHASYDYSDFMMGVAFKEGGSLTNELKILYRFAMCATLNPSRLHVLHIDEINRGNVARIFGEALMAMEKRKFPVTLRDGTWFTMPDNLLIIGTMNSADHHIQPMDQALRRRFCFVPLLPMDADKVDWISPGKPREESPAKQLYSEVLKAFKLEEDDTLWNTNFNGLDLREFAIGPSFFKLGENVEDTWQNVVEFNWKPKVKPQLSEYEKEGIVSSGTVAKIEAWIKEQNETISSDD